MPGGDLGSYPREVKEHRRRRGNGEWRFVNILCRVSLSLNFKLFLDVKNQTED